MFNALAAVYCICFVSMLLVLVAGRGDIERSWHRTVSMFLIAAFWPVALTVMFTSAWSDYRAKRVK